MEVKPGLYRHHKGAIVQVLGVAQDCQTSELIVVGIKMGDFNIPNELKTSRLRVRKLSEFIGKFTPVEVCTIHQIISCPICGDDK